MQMTDQLLPCPFCGVGATHIKENGKVWLGMRYSEPSSVSVIHWCPEIDGQPSRRIERVGRDEESAIGAWNRRAAASAQATAPVGWFVQRSSFGPWIEVERYEDGAVRLHRMDGDQATGQAVTEGYKLVPAEPTDEMVDAACPVGEVVDHFDMKMALRSGIAAAPSPAAREAGDGVKLTDEQRKSIQECIDYLTPAARAFSDLGLPGMGDSKHARCIRTLRALLREAGSR